MTNETQRVKIEDNYYNVPILTIRNPKNIPFSYHSLIELIQDEFDYMSRLSGLSLPFNIIGRFILFDDFSQGQFYIPDDIESETNNCLKTNDIEIKHRIKNTIYTITGRYVINDDFDMFWDSSESFVISIGFKVKSVFEDNLEDNTFKIIEGREEMIEIVHDIRLDDSFVFENPIWECFTDRLVDYKTFIDTDWQYIDVQIIPF